MKTLKNISHMLNYAKKYTSHFLESTVIDGIIWGIIHCYSSVIFLKLLFDYLQKSQNIIDIFLLVIYSAIFLIIAYTYHEWYAHKKRPEPVVFCVSVVYERTIYRKIYLRMNSTASTYMSGVTFLPLPAARLSST